MKAEVGSVVGTTNNYTPISMSINKAARGLIKRSVEVSEGTLNMIEMAFRAYDPCFGCATHSMPGKMPSIVRIRDAPRTVLEEIKRN